MMKEDFYHSLRREDARARLQALGEYWGAHYNVHTEWDGYRATIRGKVLGIRFHGLVTINLDHVRGELFSGFWGARLGGRGYLLRKLKVYLDPHHSLEELRTWI